jgi:hypothetical protein
LLFRVTGKLRFPVTVLSLTFGRDGHKAPR